MEQTMTNRTLSEQFLTVHEYHGEGYQPLVDYQSWRVAILRYIDELLPENLTAMQRHDETDEIFVLLNGRCLLFLGDGTDETGGIHPVDMEPLKLYNVKRGCWHTHTLSQDAVVLIVENQDTTVANSPSIPLSPVQQAEIVSFTGQAWPA
jgi:hypothetical protein